MGELFAHFDLNIFIWGKFGEKNTYFCQCIVCQRIGGRNAFETFSGVKNRKSALKSIGFMQ